MFQWVSGAGGRIVLIFEAIGFHIFGALGLDEKFQERLGILPLRTLRWLVGVTAVVLVARTLFEIAEAVV